MTRYESRLAKGIGLESKAAGAARLEHVLQADIEDERPVPQVFQGCTVRFVFHIEVLEGDVFGLPIHSPSPGKLEVQSGQSLKSDVTRIRKG
jgi:hypothetical protein